MSDKFVVVSGNYMNDTGRQDFIQAIGTYNDMRQAYGVAILQLNEFVDQEKNEMITPLFDLDTNTGMGMEVKHERYTDFCYILFCGPDEWGDKDGGAENAKTQ